MDIIKLLISPLHHGSNSAHYPHIKLKENGWLKEMLLFYALWVFYFRKAVFACEQAGRLRGHGDLTLLIGRAEGKHLLLNLLRLWFREVVLRDRRGRLWGLRRLLIIFVVGLFERDRRFLNDLWILELRLLIILVILELVLIALQTLEFPDVSLQLLQSVIADISTSAWLLRVKKICE